MEEPMSDQNELVSFHPDRGSQSRPFAFPHVDDRFDLEVFCRKIVQTETDVWK